MTKDDKKKVAPETGEILIEGGGVEQKEGIAVGDSVLDSEDAVEVPSKETPESPASTREATEGKEGAEFDSGTKDIAAEAEAVVAEAERIAKAEQEVAALRDKYLRLQAEWDNYRKRTAEEASDMRARAAEKLMGDVLPVLDDFERAIAHAENNGEAGLLGGVQAISAKLNEIFAKHGLEVIEPVGQAFDALEHQAVSTVEDMCVPDETVAQVHQKGYRLGKKVLRPAVVTISTGGPKRESEDAAGDGAGR